MISEFNDIKSAAVDDKEKLIKSKQCNKFSIENILGLNDNAKVNRLELMDLCQKGKVDPFPSAHAQNSSFFHKSLINHNVFICRTENGLNSSI